MLPKEFNPPKNLDEFYAGFSEAEKPEQKMLLVMRAAVIDENKKEGKFFQDALEILEKHLLANSEKISNFVVKLPELRSKYMEKLEKYIYISSWNRLQALIFKHSPQSLQK